MAHRQSTLWRLPRGGIVILCAVLVLLATRPLPARAQPPPPETFTVMLRGVPLEQALETLVATTQINLVYDTRLMRETRVFCTTREAPAEVLLRCILDDAGLDFYRTSSGTYVLTEATRRPPRYGQLAGVVVDARTGAPLPHANVLLADAGVGTAANEAGLFSFSSLVSGTHRVVVTYVGYETAVDSVRVPPGERARQRIALRPQPVAVRPVIVNGLQQRLPSEGLGRGTVRIDALTAPHSVGAADVLRSTGSLLGVALREPQAALHIQGGAAGAHQILLDGVPVRSPLALGRLLGAFSPLAVERVTVHKAGFGAAHGSQLAGIVAVEHTLGGPSPRHAVLQLDPLTANGRVNTHWTGPGALRGRAMVALRTSLWDVFHAPALGRLLQRWHVVDPLLAAGKVPPIPPGSAPRRPEQHRADVVFSDLHAAVRLRLNPFHTVSASLYRGHSRVDSRAVLPLPADTALLTRDRYHWTSWTGQVRYEWLMGARALGKVRLYGSRQNLGHGYRMTDAAAGPRGPYDGNRVSEVGLEARLDYNVAARHHLSGALTLERTTSRASIYNDFFRTISYADTAWRLAGFVQDELSLGLHTTLEAGTRLTYVFDRRTLYAEPRLAVRYDGSGPLLGDYALRLAGGVYRQFVNRFDLSSTGPTALVPSLRFWLPVDRSLAPPRAYHLAAEALLKPLPGWQINLEAYHKWQPRLLAVDYPALMRSAAPAPEPAGQAAFIAPTSGRAYGAGLRLRRTDGRLQGTLSYNFSRSLRRFPGRFEGRLEPTPWNQPHRLMLEGRLALTAALTARLGWRGVWGRSWAFRRAYYDYLAPRAAPGAYAPFDLNDPSAQVLPPLYRLDAGLAYERAFGGLAVGVRADLVNVLDRRNAFDWSLRPAGSGYEQAARTLPGRHLVLSVRLGY